ncbi:hypothetical protein HDU83_005378 [Entophlyctis luteolus]|nr:hypothetical protein HDU83_005378 [Entophlyctis luteolus]KAJ3382727.1 hypothetical protein HDU84_004081 [Entophlyctis sp. JEL0112]
MNFSKFGSLGAQLEGAIGGLLGGGNGSQQQQQMYVQPQNQYGQQGYQPQPYGQQPPGPQHSQQQPQLPPGWIAQWNSQYQRNFYVDTATGKSQWEPPAFAPPPGPPPASYAAPEGPPPGSSPFLAGPTGGQPDPAGNADLNSYYNLNAPPQQAPSLQTPEQQNQGRLFIPANAQNQYHSGIPMQPAVGTVDPTVAIALELSQSIPSLMKAPPAGSKIEVMDAWRYYLRRIQDAQNQHTRAIRDAQVDHDRQIKDAHYQEQQYKLSSGTNLLSGLLHGGSGLGYAAESAVSQRVSLQQRLDDAQNEYNRSVEHAHQALNDAVESANRQYEDDLRNNI